MNPGLAMAMARQRERELRRLAASAERAGARKPAAALRGRPAAPRRRVGTWTGLLLVRVGQRLAGADVLGTPHAPRVPRSV